MFGAIFLFFSAPPTIYAGPASQPAWIARDVQAQHDRDNARTRRGVIAGLGRAIDAIDLPAAERDTSDWHRQWQASTQPSPSDIIDEQVAPNARDGLRRFWQDDLFRACIGACGQSHEVGRRTLVAKCMHAATGQVKNWILIQSSGSVAFDAAVMNALVNIASQRFSAFATEPIPEWSLWSVSEVTYRWSAVERLLDPLFKPPGKRAQNGATGNDAGQRNATLGGALQRVR